MPTSARPEKRARSIGILAAGIALGLAAAACAPRVDGPAERQRAADREDGDRLARQLAALPGAVHAHATVRHAIADPLSAAPAGGSSAAILVVVDDRADVPTIQRLAGELTRATLPRVAAPTVIVAPGGPRPTLAKVGPFSVEAGSRAPLRALLALALAAIAGLAIWVGVREWQRAPR